MSRRWDPLEVKLLAVRASAPKACSLKKTHQHVMERNWRHAGPKPTFSLMVSEELKKITLKRGKSSHFLFLTELSLCRVKSPHLVLTLWKTLGQKTQVVWFLFLCAFHSNNALPNQRLYRGNFGKPSVTSVCSPAGTSNACTYIMPLGPSFYFQMNPTSGSH